MHRCMYMSVHVYRHVHVCHHIKVSGMVSIRGNPFKLYSESRILATKLTCHTNYGNMQHLKVLLKHLKVSNWAFYTQSTITVTSGQKPERAINSW